MQIYCKSTKIELKNNCAEPLTMQKKPDDHELAAVILSGGLSTRMGRDKAMLHPYGEQKPNLLSRTHAILNHNFNKIWISCAKGKSRKGYTCIFDQFHEIGPVAGIYAGLKKAQEENCKGILVLPCDLPLIDERVIQILLKARAEHINTVKGPHNLMTTFIQEKTRNIEPLIAIYEVQALERFAKAIEDGICAPRLIIPEQSRTYITYQSSLSNYLYNLNTAEEFKQFQKKYAK